MALVSARILRRLSRLCAFVFCRLAHFIFPGASDFLRGAEAYKAPGYPFS
jgi:hypothetical protein